MRGPPFIMGSSLILSIVPMYFILNNIDNITSMGTVTDIALFSGALYVLPVLMERAILANVTLPRSRGQANSILSIFDDLGKGLGPDLVSILIQAFERQTAFNISLLGWLVPGSVSLSII